ncbi:MAG: hypothetical protein M1837_006641 [Sclerophora amabilis]|nr:MAG: hypothetical protein M1837_006641 [Sclerophora amabilis]
MNQGLRQEYLGQTSKDERKVVKAFIKHNNDNALKTKPKGFEKDHPNLDLLRLRNYTIGRKLEDSQVVGPLGLEQIAELMGTLTPFVTYLNGVVMPDNDPHPPSSTAGSSDDGEDETEGGSD